ncbi:MAG: FAD-dependent thymidylate synthase [Proteobacteria bacterium]|nr:FAD-dependent thymidylate synthase [Pseudomonadota bacterium]
MALTPEQLAEIKEASQREYKTKRSVAPELEEILFEPIPVLDHGFIRVVDYMGDDAAIVQAARVSYGRGTKKLNEDRGLIRYLMRHWHTTPFEMCEIKFHVKLPIFVARQWIRHRTANVNEYSARYSILDSEFYLPKAEHLAAQSQNNKQGRGKLLVGEEAARVMELLKSDAERCHKHYVEMLNLDPATDGKLEEDKEGLARELARMNIPVNFYTQWYWKIDLHNLLHFVRLRADPHAQYEIRVYADAILDVIKRWVPHTYEAFMSYRANSASLSAEGLAALKRMLAGETVTQENSGMSKREWEEFLECIK